MELKDGFKASDAGPIPADWSARPLGDCLASRPAYGINAPAVPYATGLPTYVRITDITEDGRFSLEQRSSVDSPTSSSYLLRDGDLVVARTGASVGKSYLYDPVDGQLVYAGFLIRIQPDPTHLNPRFLAAYLSTDRYWQWIHLMSARSGQPGVNGKEYASLPVPLPPIDEQGRIVAVLGDSERQIRAIERLIVKQRSLAAGLRQQLLTGDLRLDGFSADWEEAPLADFGQWRGGATPSMDNPSFWNGGTMPWVASGDVKTLRLSDTNLRITDAAVRGSSTTVVPAESIVIVTRSGILRRYLPVALTIRPVAINQDLKALMPNDNVDPEFLLQMLRLRGPAILASCLKTGTTVESVEFSWLKSYRLPKPPFEEQRAIGSVLRDADEAVAALERQLAKVKDIRRALNQELTSGRLRLA